MSVDAQQHMAEREQLLPHPERYPGLRRLPSAQLRLWRHPSFQTWASWSVHHDRRENEVWLRRITSGSSRQDPSTLGHWAAEARLELELLRTLERELAELRVPALVSPDHFGLDGTMTGLCAGPYVARTRFEWWCEAPPAFAELERWHGRARALFEAALPEWSAMPWKEG